MQTTLDWCLAIGLTWLIVSGSLMPLMAYWCRTAPLMEEPADLDEREQRAA